MKQLDHLHTRVGVQNGLVALEAGTLSSKLGGMHSCAPGISEALELGSKTQTRMFLAALVV